MSERHDDVGELKDLIERALVQPPYDLLAPRPGPLARLVAETAIAAGYRNIAEPKLSPIPDVSPVQCRRCGRWVMPERVEVPSELDSRGLVAGGPWIPDRVACPCCDEDKLNCPHLSHRCGHDLHTWVNGERIGVLIEWDEVWEVSGGPCHLAGTHER